MMVPRPRSRFLDPVHYSVLLLPIPRLRSHEDPPVQPQGWRAVFFELTPGLLSAPKEHPGSGQTRGTKNGRQARLDPCGPAPHPSSQLSLLMLNYCKPSPLPGPALPSPVLCMGALTSYFSEKTGP